VVSPPIVSIPCLAVPNRMNELTNSVPPLLSQESGFLYDPISDNVHEHPLGRALVSSVSKCNRMLCNVYYVIA